MTARALLAAVGAVLLLGGATADDLVHYRATPVVAGNVLTGLREDSPAYRAGLRNGMRIVKREFGEVGNATVEYGLRVTENGQERVIRFMPRTAGTEMIQRLVLTPNMSPARKAACARTTSGG